MAVESAMANQQALKSAIGDGSASAQISVLSVVQLQTRGVLNRKLLEDVKNHMLIGGLPGAILIVYPQIASNAYKATRVVVAESAPGDDGDEDMSSDSDDSKSATGDAAGEGMGEGGGGRPGRYHE